MRSPPTPTSSIAPLTRVSDQPRSRRLMLLIDAVIYLRAVCLICVCMLALLYGHGSTVAVDLLSYIAVRARVSRALLTVYMCHSSISRCL